MAGEPKEAAVRTNLLLGTAAVGLLITGAIAQTSSSIERIKDPGGHQNATRDTEPKKNVRTVYPNTQNAEQAIEQSKGARGGADASKRQPGDVTPLSSAQQSSAPVGGKVTTTPSASAEKAQQSAQTPSTPQSVPADKAQQATSGPQQTPVPATQTTPAPSQPAPAPTQTAQPATPPAQPSSAPPPTAQSAPTATAQQSSAPSESPAPQLAKQASSGIVALDTQQQTSIGQAVAQRGVKPLTNVTFSIAVGTKVPVSVQLRALPSDIATFLPQYRGYSYVAVEEQILIVDPGTHDIVAIVPYTAAVTPTQTVETSAPQPQAVEASRKKPAVAQKPMVSRSVNLNTEEKAAPRQHATEQRKKTTTRSVVKREYREERRPPEATREYRGERAPRTVTVEESQPIYQPVPRPRGFFDFFRSEDED
jgi:hypothetical protein